jgi:hypothetical protein
MRKTPETVATLRGIRSQVTRAINTCRDGADVTLPVGLARRIEKALGEHIRTESILTEPENHA